MENFWNEFKKSDIELPKTILEVQRKLFNDNIPENTLVCEITEAQEEIINPWDDLVVSPERPNKPKSLVCNMYILAPALKNYRVLLLKVSYEISKVYPCNITSIFTGEQDIQCENSQVFKSSLKTILHSEAISNLIGVLLAQVG